MQRRVLIILAAVTAILIGGGVAWASIPGPDGVIHGCYKTSNPATGSVIVIDSEASCPSGFTALNWRDTQGSVAAPTAWESLSVEGGWTVASSYGGLRVRREGDVVRLTGVVSGSEGAGSVVTVLPPSYRPSGVRTVSGATRMTATDVITVDVQPGGQITVFGPLPGSWALSGTFVLN